MESTKSKESKFGPVLLFIQEKFIGKKKVPRIECPVMEKKDSERSTKCPHPSSECPSSRLLYEKKTVGIYLRYVTSPCEHKC